jgi:hypothetical protein
MYDIENDLIVDARLEPIAAGESNRIFARTICRAGWIPFFVMSSSRFLSVSVSLT